MASAKRNRKATNLRWTLGLMVCAAIAACGSSVVGEEDSPDAGLRWDQRYLHEAPVFRLLVKPEGCGGLGPEWYHYQDLQTEKPGAVLTDPEREPGLREMLEKYPDSEYADDAALLLARAKLFYHNDPEGAIRDLYKVIEDYPNGHWIAEDGVWLDYIAPTALSGKVPERGRGYGTLRPEAEPEFEWRIITYFEYLENDPHLTVDMAKYWIAQIIISKGLSKRFPEAERNFKEVIEAHRNEGRTAKDREAAKQPHANLISRIWRIERKCHQELIRFYARTGREAESRSALEDYASLYEGHDSIGILQGEIDRLLSR